MEAIAIERTNIAGSSSGVEDGSRALAGRTKALFPDPLAEDAPSDEIVITTRRAIGRVALVATRAATRFEREAVAHDPMTWMFAKRTMFDGAAAVDACLDRDACLRGILLHSLGLGMDAERSAMDVLLAGEDDDYDEHEFRYLYGARPSRRARADARRASPAARIRLYTATIVDTRDNRMSQIFHASLARDATEIRTRLAGRFGPDMADAADIRVGVHITSPPIIALVPAAVIELIQRMERDCAQPHARSFSVDIELGIQA